MSSQTPYYAHGSPVVVQGQSVSAPYNKADIPVSNYSNNTAATGDFTKGQQQPKRCNDVFFALLFYAHLALMGVLAAVYTPQMYDNVAQGGERRGLEEDENENVPDPGEILAIVGTSFVVAFVVSGLTLSFMMSFAEGLIKVALW